VYLGWFSLGLVLNAILYTWVFNNTRGGLLPVIFLHASQQVTFLFLARTPSPLLETSLLAALVLLIVGLFGSSRFTRQGSRPFESLPQAPLSDSPR
jgi:hypothetical protein